MFLPYMGIYALLPVLMYLYINKCVIQISKVEQMNLVFINCSFFLTRPLISPQYASIVEIFGDL